jgi:hypothetical protein
MHGGGSGRMPFGPSVKRQRGRSESGSSDGSGGSSGSSSGGGGGGGGSGAEMDAKSRMTSISLSSGRDIELAGTNTDERTKPVVYRCVYRSQREDVVTSL